MAIIYKKGKKDLEYTGVDKAMHKFGNAVEKIKSGVKRAATAIPRAQKRHDKGQARKEIKDIERAFGTLDKYVEFNPDFRGRAESLRKRAK